MQAKRVTEERGAVLSSLEIILSQTHTNPLCCFFCCALCLPLCYLLQSTAELSCGIFSSQPQPLFTLLSTHLPRDHTSPGYHTQLEPFLTPSCLTLCTRMKCCATSFLVRMLTGSLLVSSEGHQQSSQGRVDMRGHRPKLRSVKQNPG